MAVVPPYIVNQLAEWDIDAAELRDMGGNGFLWTTASEWWEYALDDDILHDKNIQKQVDMGIVDDLEAPWIVGNRQDWQPLLAERARDVKRLVKVYEHWEQTGELPRDWA